MPIIAPDDSLLVAEDLADVPGAPFAETVVAMVCEAVRAECGWHIAPERTETVTLDGSGASVQHLPTMRLTAVDSLIESGTPVTVDGDTVQWSRAGYLWRAGGWTRRLRGIVATITHGYDACPSDLALAIGQLCAVASANPIVASEAAGAVSVSYRQLTNGMEDVSQRAAANAIIAKYTLPMEP